LKQLAPAAAAFILYNVAAAGPERALHLGGMLAGLICGVVLTRNIGEGTPSLRLVAGLASATMAIAFAFAVPLRGMANVKPEIERVVAIEGRTTGPYQTEVARFKDGRISAEKLAQIIDRTITPELQAARARLQTLTKVPRDQQLLVAAADDYLRLRDESWRLRAEALHRSSMTALRKADKTERAALEAFEKIKRTDVPPQP
jgi:hypothetical protein